MLRHPSLGVGRAKLCDGAPSLVRRASSLLFSFFFSFFESGRDRMSLAERKHAEKLINQKRTGSVMKDLVVEAKKRPARVLSFRSPASATAVVDHGRSWPWPKSGCSSATKSFLFVSLGVSLISSVLSVSRPNAIDCFLGFESGDMSEIQHGIVGVFRAFLASLRDAYGVACRLPDTVALV